MRAAAWRCQSPGPRTLLEKRQSEAAGELPRPVSREVWGCRRGPAGLEGQAKGRRGGLPEAGRAVWAIVTFPQRPVCEGSVLVVLGVGEAFRGADGVAGPPPGPAAAWASLQGLGHTRRAAQELCPQPLRPPN